MSGEKSTDERSGAIEKRLGLTALFIAIVLYPIAVFTGFLGDLTTWLSAMRLQEAIFLMLFVIGINVAIRGYY